MNKITKKRVIGLFVVSLLAGLFAFTAVGCRNVEPVTSADFESAASELGYTTTDVTSRLSETSWQIDKCLSFDTEDGLHVEFIEFGSKDDAVSFYSSNSEELDNRKGNGAVSTSVQNSSHSKSTLKTSETYYVVEQVGSTALFAYCPVDSSEAVDEVIAAINY